MADFDDEKQGGTSDDTLTGGSGDDKLEGGAGDDMLKGLSGDDTLIGGSGQDMLKGHAGDDVLYGGEGDDILQGHGGDDTLRGGSGDDNLSGATGDDILYGGDGDDTLDGGEGADTFVSDAGAEGTTTVNDFEEEEGDFIQVKGVEDHTKISVEELDVDGDGSLDTVVELGTGSTLVVKDRALDDWNDDDYESVAPEGGENVTLSQGPQEREEPQESQEPQVSQESQGPQEPKAEEVDPTAIVWPDYQEDPESIDVETEDADWAADDEDSFEEIDVDEDEEM